MKFWITNAGTFPKGKWFVRTRSKRGIVFHLFGLVQISFQRRKE